MVAHDADSLAQLAAAIGRPEAESLRRRAAKMRSLIAAHLWDVETGAYVNRLARRGAERLPFNRRVSPTSFYPLMTGAASDEHALSLVRRWLTSKERFCVTPARDFAPLTTSLPHGEKCYWGLPSISADDRAYRTAHSYWRGLIWGPMALLTYWGLQRYDHVAEVAAARRGLCKQMGGLFLDLWRRHAHVCENYSPLRDASACSGMRFYHWGALTGFIGLLEAGHYERTH